MTGQETVAAIKAMTPEQTAVMMSQAQKAYGPAVQMFVAWSLVKAYPGKEDMVAGILDNLTIKLVKE